MNSFETIISEFSKIESARAIVMSGSRTTNVADEISDIDLYVYTDKEINLSIRKEIFEESAFGLDLDNRYWELGDEITLKDNNVLLDIMYRSPLWLEEQVENVFIKNCASLGYTTCFLHNIKTSNILYDKKNWFKGLQDKVSGTYPDELSKNIIEKNLPLLKEKRYTSYYEQIEKAIKRKDYVSINHRLSTFFASYFDILFALNKVFHPGEKRQISFVKSECKLIPENFEEHINAVICAPCNEKIAILDKLVANLYKIVNIPPKAHEFR